MAKENKSNIIIYQSEDGQTHIEVQMDEDTYGYPNSKWPTFTRHLEQMW